MYIYICILGFENNYYKNQTMKYGYESKDGLTDTDKYFFTCGCLIDLNIQLVII